MLQLGQFVMRELGRHGLQGMTSQANHLIDRSVHRGHEEVKPPLIGECDTKDLRPEAVCGHHGIGFLSLRWIERSECIAAVTIFE